MPTPVSIVSISSLSSLGANPETIWNNYQDNKPCMESRSFGGKYLPVAALPAAESERVSALREAHPKYQNLDNSVLYAILASRSAVENAGWGENDIFGINIGSSRGATDLFEKHHAEFLQTGKTGIQASPATTLGNISSWVAQDLRSTGPEISHSITCSTSLHALLNGVAWLRAGMADKFLTGGSEAPLTPFTMAQIQAMKIHSADTGEYPCHALDLGKKHNSMVLGEGAASACLEIGEVPHALAYITGIGYATETLRHSVSLSADAECLQKSMLMALGDTNPAAVDAVVMHAPGTIKGDLAEFNAVKSVFGDNLPLLTTNKWKLGHTFGASGLLSLEMAVLMAKHNTFIGVPFFENRKTSGPIKNILVNAVGFGGNAVSVLITANG